MTDDGARTMKPSEPPFKTDMVGVCWQCGGRLLAGHDCQPKRLDPEIIAKVLSEHRTELYDAAPPEGEVEKTVAWLEDFADRIPAGWIDRKQICDAAALLAALSAKYDATAKRAEEAETAISWANNSLFGSQGFYLSTNGGPPNPHHLDTAIERLKAEARRMHAAESELRLAREALKAADAMALDYRKNISELARLVGTPDFMLATVDAYDAARSAIGDTP